MAAVSSNPGGFPPSPLASVLGGLQVVPVNNEIVWNQDKKQAFVTVRFLTSDGLIISTNRIRLTYLESCQKADSDVIQEAIDMAPQLTALTEKTALATSHGKKIFTDYVHELNVNKSYTCTYVKPGEVKTGSQITYSDQDLITMRVTALAVERFSPSMEAGNLPPPDSFKGNILENINYFYKNLPEFAVPYLYSTIKGTCDKIEDKLIEDKLLDSFEGLDLAQQKSLVDCVIVHSLKQPGGIKDLASNRTLAGELFTKYAGILFFQEDPTTQEVGLNPFKVDDEFISDENLLQEFANWTSKMPVQLKKLYEETLKQTAENYPSRLQEDNPLSLFKHFLHLTEDDDEYEHIPQELVLRLEKLAADPSQLLDAQKGHLERAFKHIGLGGVKQKVQTPQRAQANPSPLPAAKDKGPRSINPSSTYQPPAVDLSQVTGGIQNTGSSCFLNAPLQCLLAIPEFEASVDAALAIQQHSQIQNILTPLRDLIAHKKANASFSELADDVTALRKAIAVYIGNPLNGYQDSGIIFETVLEAINKRSRLKTSKQYHSEEGSPVGGARLETAEVGTLQIRTAGDQGKSIQQRIEALKSVREHQEFFLKQEQQAVSNHVTTSEFEGEPSDLIVIQTAVADGSAYHVKEADQRISLSSLCTPKAVDGVVWELVGTCENHNQIHWTSKAKGQPGIEQWSTFNDTVVLQDVNVVGTRADYMVYRRVRPAVAL